MYKLRSGLPYSFNRSYDDLSGYRTCSVLTFPLKTNRGDVIGVLQLINGKDAKGKVIPFKKTDEPLILNFANTAAVAIERAQMTRAMILRTIRMAELRDPKETGAHVNRVASYAVTIYEHWAGKRGLGQEEIDKNRDVLRMAAMLHDVGKVAISDTILKKPARFTPEEYEIMKQHTVFGASLFSDLYSDFDEAASVVALNHHEFYDGNGYPGYINLSDGKPASRVCERRRRRPGQAGRGDPGLRPPGGHRRRLRRPFLEAGIQGSLGPGAGPGNAPVGQRQAVRSGNDGRLLCEPRHDPQHQRTLS